MRQSRALAPIRATCLVSCALLALACVSSSGREAASALQASSNANAASMPSLVVAYEVPKTCPDFGSYAGQVRERTSRFEIRLGEPALRSEARDIEIHLHESGAGYTGQLSMRAPSPLQREVSGEHCADVVAALALITVLRLEAEPALEQPPGPAPALAMPEAPAKPEARATPEAPAAPEAPFVPEVPAAPEAPVAREAPVVPEPPAAPEIIAAPEISASPENASDLATPREPLVETSSGAEGRAARDRASPEQHSPLGGSVVAYVGYASVPAHALELALEGELRFGSEPTAWASAFTLALARGTTASSSGRATLTLATAQLALCPSGLGLGRSWLQACAFVRGGWLDFSTSPSEVPIEPIDATRPWGAAGLNAELGVPLSSRWSLRWLGELGIQLVRDRFEVERIVLEGEPRVRVELYRPEMFSLELALGIAHAF